jgi:hypothetical protein
MTTVIVIVIVVVVIVLGVVVIARVLSSAAAEKLDSEAESNKIASQLYNGKLWQVYRLGDAYICQPDLANDSAHKALSSFPPSSLAYQYLSRNRPCKPRQLHLLTSIMDENERQAFLGKEEQQRTGVFLPPTTLVLHIRVGDIFCYTDHPNYKEQYAKVGNLKWWDCLVRRAREQGITDIEIVSGTHLEMCLKESADYLLDRKRFLEKNGFRRVTFRLGHNPDEDMMHFRKARWLTSTAFGEKDTGRYGNLAMDLVRDNGGRILEIDCS